jgi:hypothetical protein
MAWAGGDEVGMVAVVAPSDPTTVIADVPSRMTAAGAVGCAGADAVVDGFTAELDSGDVGRGDFTEYGTHPLNTTTTTMMIPNRPTLCRPLTAEKISERTMTHHHD